MASAFICEELPRTLECIVCKTEFSFFKSGAGRFPRFCSPECKATRVAGQQRIYSSEKRYPSHRTNYYAVREPIEFTCQECGKVAMTKWRKAKYCSKECTNKGKSKTLRQARPIKVCDHCGNEFETTMFTSTQRFCSRSCSAAGNAASRRVYPSKEEAKRALYARQKAKRLEARVKVECEVCLSPFTAHKDTKKRTCSPECSAKRSSMMYKMKAAAAKMAAPPKICKMCGVQIGQDEGARGRHKFCSVECANKNDRLKYGGNNRRRARRHGVPYEPVNKIKVFDRDAWRCQMCGVKTPKKLMGSFDDKAPELDHRIPMAMGGPHSYDNVQCSCRKCNLAKGGYSASGQMNLFPSM